MSRDLNKLLHAPDKKFKEASNLLSRLFRQILMDLDVTPSRWHYWVTRYFHSPLSKTAKNARDIGQDRNNFNRALAKDRITWNNFFKALQITGPEWIRVDITMGWKDGTKTTHSVETRNQLASLGDLKETDLSSQSIETLIEPANDDE